MTQSAFSRAEGVLQVEGVSAASLADQFGTPLYVYSRSALTDAYKAYADACIGHSATIHVAVKANSNLAVLNVFARLGAGFDIVSSGELARVLAAGGKAENTVFSGVGKTAAEMREALDAGVKCFNVESIPELHALNEVAKAAGKQA
ncbi:MAG: diaminopimelate decarboxylase, partial [Caballeronia sp.]|nr:diaminopimelate decarboxylase [Caballeronia sp.]